MLMKKGKKSSYLIYNNNSLGKMADEYGLVILKKASADLQTFGNNIYKRRGSLTFSKSPIETLQS